MEAPKARRGMDEQEEEEEDEGRKNVFHPKFSFVFSSRRQKGDFSDAACSCAVVSAAVSASSPLPPSSDGGRKLVLLWR